MPMILISSAYLRVRNNVDLKLRNHLTLELGNNVDPELRNHVNLYLGNDVNFLAIYLGNKVVADKERYQSEGAENFGYLIKPDGTETKDITLLISEAL